MPGRILLLDRIATNRIVLRFKLSASCYEVLQAATVEEAVALAQLARPDLILMDMDEADCGACDAVARFAAMAETVNVPIVVLSARTDTANRTALLRAGAEDILAKPVDEDLLLARLRRLMRRRTLAEEIDQRDTTQRQLGLAEDGASFQTRGRVALVTPDARRSEAWATALGPHVSHKLSVMSQESALAFRPVGPVPDVFILAGTATQRNGGLRVLSELRSRPETRHSAILMVLEESLDPSAAAQMGAMALDLGANDLLLGGFQPEELGLRLQRQMLHKKREDHLRHSLRDGLRMAVRDPLTGLYNRRYALPHLRRIAAAAEHRNQSFAVMLLDLDRFKNVNDTYGHAAGDSVLVEVANRLMDNLRSHDLVARIGGEEFLVVMPNTSFEEARYAADRLRDIIRHEAMPGTPSSGPFPVTCSIGVALVPPSAGAIEAMNTDSLLERADVALYRAKADGRDQITFSRPAA